MIKILRKLALLIVFTMTISAFSVCALAETADVKDEDSVLSTAIDLLKSKGITNGISETEFGADMAITREQMVAFIYRMQNGADASNAGENTTAFTDIDNPEFYTAISWAVSNGIIKGVSETEFKPHDPVSLRDCYTMLVRMFGYEKKSPSIYPQGYITIAENIGLSQNINKSEYTDELTRGDVAIILNNALNKKSHPLDGKKILFIGNSYTYYGNTVVVVNYTVDEETVLTRFNDVGYFYQLCKQNGADVTVDNWTWSNHKLSDMFGESCMAGRGHDGHDHMADLRKYSDMNYDYVVIQPHTADTNIETLKSDIKNIQDIFREVNPEVEFIYSICPSFYTREDDVYKVFTNSIDDVAGELDLKVANWGKLVYDMMTGKAVVENSPYEYNKNTFIVSKSAEDGYHPNLLTGYITTQMIYSLLTGETAVGEECAFCTDAHISEWYDLEFILGYYYSYDNISDAESEIKLTGDDLTNFPEILASKTEMAGIQKLIDEFIKTENLK